MNIISTVLTSAIGAATPAPGGFLQSGNWQMIIIMVGFLVFFYFFIIMPQNKKKKEMERMLNSLKKGDKIVTIGGIHGKVSAVKETEIVIKVDANAEVTIDKSAIARVVDGSANTSVPAKNEEKKKIDQKAEKKEKNEENS